MIVTATRAGFALDEKNDFTRFHVDASGMLATELADLATRYPEAVARYETDHLWIPVSFLARAAGAIDTPDWTEGLHRMTHTAARHGWLDEETGAIRAHIENLADTQPAPGPDRRRAPDTTRYRIAVVGLGAQGAGIARSVLDLGHEIVGAVDIGEKVGRPIGEFMGEPSITTPVCGSAEELLQSLSSPPDVVVVAATGGRQGTIRIMKDYLGRGLNVLTLHQDLFVYEPEWADDLHAYCQEHGASALATGIQDTWWVQLPALFASTTLDITKVTYNSVVSLHSLSAGILAEIGVGLDPEAFGQLVESMKGLPPVMGGPMAEAARRMGLVPGAVVHTYDPQIAEEPVLWDDGRRTIDSGLAMGTLERVVFTTDRGIDFEGTIQVLPVPVDEASDSLVISGTPDLHVEYKPFPGEALTNNGLIARIPDIIDAGPGLHFAAEMPPARHQFPR